MFETRLNTAVFSRLDSSLARLAEELTDIGVVGFNPLALQETVERRLRYFFEEPDEETCSQSLLQIGRDSESSPISAANALVWNEVAEILDEMKESVEAMSKNEFDKLNKWMKINHGSVHRVKWNALLVLNQDADMPDKETAEAVLDVSRQVMEEDPLKLRQMITSIPAEESGVKGFVRDLAIARLDTERTEELIRDIMSINDLKVIEELIDQLSEQDIPHKGPLGFLATQVRSKLKMITAAPEDELEEQQKAV